MQKIVFVSDYFQDDLIGGAELSLEAIMHFCAACFSVVTCRSHALTPADIAMHLDAYWVFGNYTQLRSETLQAIISDCRYSVLEFDYKFCKYRLPQAHAIHGESVCECHTTAHGKTVFSFLYGAQELYFMSEAQKRIYLRCFPSLHDRPTRTISSAFTDESLKFVADLHAYRASNPPMARTALVLNSTSLVKGTSQSIDYCKQHNLPYKLVGGLSPKRFLYELAGCTDLVYMPYGFDTCPRMIIEAQLLGLNIVCNDNVQHIQEPWAASREAILEHLQREKTFVTQSISRHVKREYRISSYFTTRNCMSQHYPFEHAIRSVMPFSDQIVVVDSNSTDGTLEALRALKVCFEQSGHGTMLIHSSCAYEEAGQAGASIALLDGQQKALARSLCTGDLVWQMDADEIVHEDDVGKIRQIARNFPKTPVLCLPVIEYWGGFGKVRMDSTPWKWRMSWNSPRITHGVPIELRTPTGCLDGTDGCDLIDRWTGDRISCHSFWSEDIAQIRELALRGNALAVQTYSKWFSQVVAALPSVHHLSWLDIPRKIRLYRKYWSHHWDELYGRHEPTNAFFGRPWSQVSEEEIDELGGRLASQTGGHIFHERWTGASVPFVDPLRYHLPCPPSCLESGR